MTGPSDFFGQEISIGDTILYPTTLADYATMNTGIVADVVVAKKGYREQEVTKLKVHKLRNSGPYQAGAGKEVTIEKLDRVVVYRKGGTS